MNGSSGSGNTCSSSWPSSAPFYKNVYLLNYAEGLEARRFKAVPARGDSLTVYDALYVVRCVS